jgi:crossover junction endodeoxyribonuclease RuvC
MSSKAPLSSRVRAFHDFFHHKIIEHQVTLISLETPFLGKNPQNFLKLGYMRGLLYLLQDVHTIALREFAPAEVKRSVTGYGAADKEQVARLVVRLFPALHMPSQAYDMTDAVAVTLCAAWASSRSSMIISR